MKRNSGVKKGVKCLVVGVVYSYKVIEVTLMYGNLVGSQQSARAKFVQVKFAIKRLNKHILECD